MSKANHSIIAVVTGDVIESQTSAGSATWLEVLRNYFQMVGPAPSTWEIYRGDSFQVRPEEPAKVIRWAIKLKALIKSIEKHKLDVRMAVGIGTFDLLGDRITESQGEAFVNSGTLFDKLKKRRLAVRTPWPGVDEEINLYLELASLTMDHWDSHAAKVISTSMDMPDARQREIGSRMSQPQPRISEGQTRGGFKSIMKMEKRCRAILERHIEG